MDSLLQTGSYPSSPSRHTGEGIMHETVKAKHNYHQVCEITLTVLSYSVLYAFFLCWYFTVSQMQLLKNLLLAVKSLDRNLCILEKATQAKSILSHKEPKDKALTLGYFKSISL